MAIIVTLALIIIITLAHILIISVNIIYVNQLLAPEGLLKVFTRHYRSRRKTPFLLERTLVYGLIFDWVSNGSNVDVCPIRASMHQHQ